MYLDTTGNVTVGVGLMLASADAAVPVPFVRKFDDGSATEDEKRNDWNTIKGEGKGRVAGFYNQFASLKLDQADIDDLLKTKLEEFESALKRTFDDFDSFPNEAQEGLIDMVYNLGLAKLLTFKNFVAAVNAPDWDRAAAECHRKGISQERNDAVRELLEAAG